MAGETLRDVVIRIKLEQVDNKLAPPDVSAFNSVVDQARQKAAAVASGGGGVDTQASEAAGRANAVKQIFQETEQANAAEATRRQLLQQSEAAEANLASAQRNRIEALTGMGSAALQAGRGIAFLTAANEDDLKVGLQAVAMAQGLFDTFGGLATVYKQSIAVRQSLAAVTKAQAAADAVATVANGALATSNTVVATTGAAAAASTVALSAPLIAAGAAIGAFVVYARSMDESLKGSIARTQQQEQALKNLTTAADRYRSIAQQNDQRAGYIAQVAPNNLDSQQRFLDAQRSQLPFLERDVFKGATTDADLNSANAAKQINAAIERRIALDEQDLQIALRRRDQIEQELATVQQIQQSARERVAAEEANLRSVEERIGRLTASEQARLRTIVEQVKAGKELQRTEVEFLDQRGLGGELSKNFFQKQGQQAGAADYADALGISRALQQANQNLKTANATVGEVGRELVEQQRENDAKIADTFQKLLASQIELAKSIAAIQSAYAELDRKGKDRETGRKSFFSSFGS